MKAAESPMIYPSPPKLPSENTIRVANREKYQFASDNKAGLCPEVMEALVRYPCEANAVFADLPPAVHSSLQNRGWHYYTFIGSGGARFMCSWSTTEENVAELLRDCAEV